MGESQITKFFEKDRIKEFGMVGPTLSNPDVVIEEASEARDGKTERPSSFVYVKTFNRNGEKIKFFASITVKKDGMEVSVSSHYVNKNKAITAMQEGNVLYIREALSPNSSEMRLTEHQNDVPDLLPTQENNAVSDGKDTKFSDKEEIKSKKNANVNTDHIPDATKMVEDNKQEKPSKNDGVIENNTNFAENNKDNGNKKEAGQGASVLQRDSQKEFGSNNEVTGGTRPKVDRLESRVAQAQRDARSIAEIEDDARTFAKENGLWIPYTDIMKHTPFQSGNESDNYIDEEHGLLYKVNNLMHSHGRLADNFESVRLYNELFPETKLTFVGLTSVSKIGTVFPVYTQEFINDAVFASEDDIKTYMHERGFESTTKEAEYSVCRIRHEND